MKKELSYTAEKYGYGPYGYGPFYNPLEEYIDDYHRKMVTQQLLRENNDLRDQNLNHMSHIKELEYQLNKEYEHIQDLILQIEDLKKRNKKLNITNKFELMDIENEQEMVNNNKN